MQKQKYQAYAAATQTVARTKQIVMLYDGAIRFMQQAKEAIRNQRIEDRYHSLIKTSEVVIGLQGCLDFENGGEMAKVLFSFYSTIDASISTIHRSASIESCDEVIIELKKMRDVWNDIDGGNAKAEAAPVEPTVAAPPPVGTDMNITLSA